ncbi:MAG: enoyl-[acyl-carrier-protein] reductase FabK [Chloroflexi bacterium]|nr:enoyl-[acyl-carrier-protein] reductase FabK [Chloroflexota bacterium]MBU1746556.1 enoyl-[acyl-carrier-protein] reductase FabK [Chloroflexota bacterium]
MIHTPLCDLLGIEHPVIQGGMAWIATAELAAAVSEAGGLGLIGSGSAPGDWVRDQIRQVRAHTNKPFGVNILLISPNADDVFRVVLEERVPVVTTGAGTPSAYMPALKEAGTKVVPVVSSVMLARRLARQGADAFVAEGMESGGHIGDVSTMPLVPQVVDAVDVPVVAAGGFADGRGLAAALALGAAGIQMGTRFICTSECIAHPAFKHKVVTAGDRATATTGYSLGHAVRALRNPMTREFARLELEGISMDDLVEFGTGKMRLGLIEGDVENGSLMCGQVAGLVTDIVPCRQVIERIVAEAEAIIGRLPKMVKER